MRNPNDRNRRRLRGPSRRVLWRADFARILGVSLPTFTSYTARGLIPSPDLRLGRREAWLVVTVRDFLRPKAPRPVKAKTSLEARTVAVPVRAPVPLLGDLPGPGPLAGTTFIFRRRSPNGELTG
jgi:hypothetical protein